MADSPPAFPAALIPVLRIMRLGDGRSAAGPFQLDGTRLTVGEYNRDARCYHRSVRVAVLSGREPTIHELDPDPPLMR